MHGSKAEDWITDLHTLPSYPPSLKSLPDLSLPSLLVAEPSSFFHRVLLTYNHNRSTGIYRTAVVPSKDISESQNPNDRVGTITEAAV